MTKSQFNWRFALGTALGFVGLVALGTVLGEGPRWGDLLARDFPTLVLMLAVSLVPTLSYRYTTSARVRGNAHERSWRPVVHGAVTVLTLFVAFLAISKLVAAPVRTMAQALAPSGYGQSAAMTVMLVVLLAMARSVPRFTTYLLTPNRR